MSTLKEFQSKNKQNYLKIMKKKNSLEVEKNKKKLRLKIMQCYKYPLENRT